MVFQERTYGVLLVSASEKFHTTARSLLPVTDYYPVSSANSAGEARRRLLEAPYDLVLIHTPLRDEFGTRLAVDVCTSSDAGALLLVRADVYDDVYAEVMDRGVMVLPAPVSTQTVSQTLRMMCASRERLRRMQEKQASVEETIEEIRLVNRAKWMLIERLRLTEDEAHRYIERQAMDMRLPKRTVAENILHTYE